MTVTHADTTSEETKLKVGDKVIITSYGSELRGTLIEDSGLTGVKGDHIVGVTVGEGDTQSRFQTYASALRRDPTAA